MLVVFSLQQRPCIEGAASVWSEQVVSLSASPSHNQLDGSVPNAAGATSATARLLLNPAHKGSRTGQEGGADKRHIFTMSVGRCGVHAAYRQGK